MAKQQSTMVKPVDNKVAAEVDKAAESADGCTRTHHSQESS